MANEIYASIPASQTYALSRLVYARIVELEGRLEHLRPNQYSRRRKVEQELEELNVATQILRKAQEGQVRSLTERLQAKSE